MQLPRPHGRQVLELGLLVLLFLVSVAFRAWLGRSHPAYRPGDATAFYPAEAGMQYRWAEFLAGGEGLPKEDKRAQWPEGLRFGIDITPVMEHTAAFLWRILVGQQEDFFDFSILFVALVSSLPVALAYLVVRSSGGGVAAATLAAFFAAFHPAAWDRVVRNFGRENFALVWVLLPVCLLLFLWRRPSRPRSVWRREVVLALAGVGAQAIAFASWHMARALFEFHTAIFWFAVFMGWAHERERRWLQVCFLATAPLWFLLPVLAVRHYALTPNICALTVLALGAVWARSRHAQWGLVAVAALAWWLVGRFFPSHDDSHVVEVLLAKLRHFFVKPADPSALTPEARLMWIEAFESPSLAKLIWYAGVPGLAAIVLGVMGRRRVAALWRRDTAFRALVLFVLAWTFLWLVFDRLVILWVFSVAVALGRLAAVALRTRWRWGAAFVAVLTMLAVGMQAAAAPPMPRLAQLLRERFSWPEGWTFQNRLADTRDLLAWLRRNTQRDDVIVAWFGLSSQIYAYADRPVVVQSKFENPHVRPKCIELANAFYGGPQRLTEYCRRYGARYVVYEVPMVFSGGRQSYRYVAGLQALPTTSTVALMQFWPHELDSLELVYQNRGFRVFFCDQDNTITLKRHRKPYGWYPLYDRQWCQIRARDGLLDDQQLQEALRRSEELERLLAIAEGLKAEGRLSEALQLARRILTQEARLWQAAVLMARIYATSGNVAAAEKACTDAQVGYPQCPELPQHLTRERSRRDAND